MEVETYEVEECVGGVAGTTPEIEAEAAELIEQLGLEGQKKLLTRTEDGDAVRCPYRQMTGSEQHVYGVLCPTHVPIENYDVGLIPVRVLQVAAHAREFLPLLEVWHPRKSPKDPVLVGRNAKYNAPHILARWGEVLDPFERIVEKARAALRREWEAECRIKIAEAQAFLAGIDGQVEKHLAGSHVAVP